MTKGVLGIVLCPMLDDNLVYSLEKDPEKKNIFIVDNDNAVSVKRKLDRVKMEYKLVDWNDIKSNNTPLPGDEYNMVVYSIDLGLHSKPEELKTTVEDLAIEMQPYVDGIGFYLGTCGNFEWNIPAWCEKRGYKPSAMFVDENGCLCHDCVGANIAGGPRYGELQKKYTGHFYLFPAMATNFEEFMKADQADQAAVEECLTDEMREVLGIEKGPDGYLRWLLAQGDYRYILKIDTGIGEREVFDKEVDTVARRTGLLIKEAEPGWANLQPTDDLYATCKSFLKS